MVMDGKRQHPSPSPAPMEKAAPATAREKKPPRETDPPFLPIEVWTEILLRIPAEFLVTLKFVCKSWYELITSQPFARYHLDHQTSRPDNGFAIDMYHLSDGLLIRSIFYFTLHMSCEERRLQCRNFLIEDYNHYRKTQSRKEYRLLASCDGLLLIGYDEGTHYQFLICNPITGSHRRLPILQTELVHPLDISDFYEWAMVRNAASSYKVFGMPIFLDLHRTCYVLELQRAGEAGSWHNLEFEVSVTLDWWIRASRTTEGKVHWLVATTRPPKAKILSIDILTYEISTSASIDFMPETDDYFIWDGTFYCTKRWNNESSIWVLENLDQPKWVEKDRSVCPCPPCSLPISTEHFPKPEGSNLFVGLNSRAYDGMLVAAISECSCFNCLKCWHVQKVFRPVNSLIGCD